MFKILNTLSIISAKNIDFANLFGAYTQAARVIIKQNTDTSNEDNTHANVPLVLKLFLNRTKSYTVSSKRFAKPKQKAQYMISTCTNKILVLRYVGNFTFTINV